MTDQLEISDQIPAEPEDIFHPLWQQDLVCWFDSDNHLQLEGGVNPPNTALFTNTLKIKLGNVFSQQQSDRKEAEDLGEPLPPSLQEKFRGISTLTDRFFGTKNNMVREAEEIGETKTYELLNSHIQQGLKLLDTGYNFNGQEVRVLLFHSDRTDGKNDTDVVAHYIAQGIEDLQLFSDGPDLITLWLLPLHERKWDDEIQYFELFHNNALEFPFRGTAVNESVIAFIQDTNYPPISENWSREWKSLGLYTPQDLQTYITLRHELGHLFFLVNHRDPNSFAREGYALLFESLRLPSSDIHQSIHAKDVTPKHLMNIFRIRVQEKQISKYQGYRMARSFFRFCWDQANNNNSQEASIRKMKLFFSSVSGPHANLEESIEFFFHTPFIDFINTWKEIVKNSHLSHY